MSTLFLIFFAVLLGGCTSKQSNNTVYYVIKHFEIHPNKGKIKLEKLPPPPPPFYGDYSFVLLDTSKVFYHKKCVDFRGDCLTIHLLPERINLTPDSLFEIRIEDLKQFLISSNENLSKKGIMGFVSISSPSDTIRNRAYKILTDYYNQKLARYYIRNWTEEEQYVINAKMNNKPYNPDSIKWKVGFLGEPQQN